MARQSTHRQSVSVPWRASAAPCGREPIAPGTCLAAVVASGSCSPPRDRT